MGKLTIFEEKILAVLSKLQYLFDVVASYEHNTKEGVEYSFGDMIPPIEGPEEIQYVVQYLKKHGLDISITFNIDNDDPSEPIYIKKYGGIDNVPLGLIKGKNIEEIKKNIKKIINKLDPGTLIGRQQEFEMEEDIEIRNLGIKIEKNGCVSRGRDKFEINPTDQALINTLHYRFLDDKERCVSAKILAKEFTSTEKYIVNRISYINLGIKELIKNVRGPNSNINSFIRNTKGRGYNLNPKFVIEFSKKKKIKKIDLDS
jgi:hypothetical protein